MYSKIVLILFLIFLSGYASAHEWTPTYPKLEQSFVQSVLVAKMKLYNNRKNVNYYEISVWDEDWNPIRFSTGSNSVIKISYLQRKGVDVYIRKQDKDQATYICSQSKSILDNENITFISSRICSKIK